MTHRTRCPLFLGALWLAGAVRSAAPRLSRARAHPVLSRPETEKDWTPTRRENPPMPLPTVQTPPCPAMADEESSASDKSLRSRPSFPVDMSGSRRGSSPGLGLICIPRFTKSRSTSR